MSEESKVTIIVTEQELVAILDALNIEIESVRDAAGGDQQMHDWRERQIEMMTALETRLDAQSA